MRAIKENVFNFFFFAALQAKTKFIEAPEVAEPPPVEIKISKSSFFPCAKTCL